MTKVIDQSNSEHYLWGKNCDSWVLADTKGLSVKQERMPPGTNEQLHFHKNAQQFFFIIKGVATLFLDNERYIVTEQKGLLITPMTKHYIANETEEHLEFLVISQPSTHNDRITIEMS